MKYIKAWEKQLGEEVEWAILDGFLLFWDPVRVPSLPSFLELIETNISLPPPKQEVLAQLDIRIFLRVPYQTLKTRREARQVYVTQSELLLLPRLPPPSQTKTTKGQPLSLSR